MDPRDEILSFGVLLWDDENSTHHDEQRDCRALLFFKG